MAKAKGKISKMSLKKAAIAISRVEFDYFMKDGYHDQEKSYFDNKTGGYVGIFQ